MVSSSTLPGVVCLNAIPLKKNGLLSFDKYNVEQNKSVPLVLKDVIMSPFEYFFEGHYISGQLKQYFLYMR
jgi:hypothetical protein